MLTKIDKIEEIWELYTYKKFDKIIKIVEEEKNELEVNPHFKDLYLLASMEIQFNKNIELPVNSIFSDLTSAMYYYHNKNYYQSARKLANWLFNKGFFADWIVKRFFESVRESQQYDLLLKVSLHLLKQYPENPDFIQYLFYSYYHLNDYEKAISVFEQYREFFNEENLQMVGYIYLKQKKYEDAERIFLRVYKKITGKEYQNYYPVLESKYRNVYKELKEKYNKNELNQKDLIEFGMACLFTGDYKTALQIFTKVKSLMEKNILNL